MAQDPEKIKVLIVDDEADFTDSLSRRLEVRGFTVDTASSGDSAVAMIRGEDYDVVLLDVLMPGKNGIDTLKELKKLRPSLRIIMLTGHARVDTAMEGMALGAFDYLIKPPETDELVEKLQLAHEQKVSKADRIQQTRAAVVSEKKGWKKFFRSMLNRFLTKPDSPH